LNDAGLTRFIVQVQTLGNGLIPRSIRQLAITMKIVAIALLILFRPVACAVSPSIVRGDFDGDGVMDQAKLTQHQHHVTLDVQRGAGSDLETLEFRVDPAAQDAICTLPAKLSTSASSCSPMDEPLPGCKEFPGKVDLSISDDTCDSIHLYWDQNAKRMAWWRL
jgi:hypothetical protein